MKLILVRHGEANPVDGETIKTDSERTLTERGHAQARQTAEFVLSKSDTFSPDLLVVSPFIRARQTMQAFEDMLGKQAQVYNHITPVDDDKIALEYLSDLAESTQSQCVLVVCHMDIVARLHARATADSYRGFLLAEARVLEQTIIADRLSCEIANFVPQI